MESNVQIALSYELYMLQLKALQDELAKKDEQIQRLSYQLEYERDLRERLYLAYSPCRPFLRRR